MECECITDFEETPEWFDIEHRKARKEYKCCECHSIIPAGQKYIYIKGVWDSEFGFYKVCNTCYKIGNDMFPCGWYFTELWGMLKEHFGIELGDPGNWKEFNEHNMIRYTGSQ